MHCTLRAALHHQCFLCGAALHDAVHYTALCVPCCTVVVGSRQLTSCNTLSHCLGAVGSARPAIQWALPWRSGQCNSCNTLPTAWGQGPVQLLQYTASVPWGSGHSTSCNTLPYLLGAVGSATAAIHFFTGW